MKHVFCALVLFGALIASSPASADMKDTSAHLWTSEFHATAAKDATSEEPLETQATDEDELMAKAVWATLRYDHSKMTYEELRPIALHVIKESRKAKIDPFITLAIVFQESRFRPNALGDGGHACGMAQQHARFSMGWSVSDARAKFHEVKHDGRRKSDQRKYECERLKDYRYATRVMIYHLQMIDRRTKGKLERYVWWYNGREIPWHTKHLKWKRLLKSTHERILEKVRTTQPQSGDS